MSAVCRSLPEEQEREGAGTGEADGGAGGESEGFVEDKEARSAGVEAADPEEGFEGAVGEGGDGFEG